MKKKIIIAIISSISIIGAGIGGFIIGSNSNYEVIEKPMQIETEYVPLYQALYGCPISKRLKKIKNFSK